MRLNSLPHLPDPTESMTPTTRHIPPGPGFWPQVAQYLVDDAGTMKANPDLSSALVLVPAWGAWPGCSGVVSREKGTNWS